MRPSVLLAVAALLLGCGGGAPSQTPRPSPGSPARASETPPSAASDDLGPAALAVGDGWAEQVRAVDAAIAFREERVGAESSGGVLDLHTIASLRLARAQLTGDYDDFAAAEEALDLAFARAEKPHRAPHLTRARLNLALHRNDRVAQHLDQVPTNIEIAWLDPHLALVARGDLAAQQGDVAEATRRYNEAIAMKPGNPTPYAALAWLQWQTGDFEAAHGYLVDAEARTPDGASFARAWFELQRGLMDLDRGRYADALAHYRAGDERLPGWWLMHEHIAEVTLLLGHTDAAVALYEKVVVDTDGAPEFLDALAAIRRDQGDEAGAAELIAQARAAWEERLARFPEATYGHALDHFAEFGQPAAALEIAERNAALRQTGEAREALAAALLAADRAPDAVPVIEALLASPWRSADIHATAAAVFDAVGRTEDAEAQMSAARAINPRITAASD